MLPDEIQQRLREVGPTDLVIGIPSYNNARTIGSVLEAVRSGLGMFFPDARAAVVNSDAGSTDDTPGLIANAGWSIPCVLARHEAPPSERVSMPFHGLPGRGAAQLAILEAAHRLEAKACAVIGPDSRGVTPEWIDRLVRPVFEKDFDYVAPLYHRQRYDGTLTTGVIYPLTRALYGRPIRHPLGGDIGLSARLVAQLVPAWAGDPAVTRHGIDLLVLAVLARERLSVCEGWLGPCAVEASGRPSDLATIISQAIGGTFAVLERTSDVWVGVRGSEPVPVVGVPVPPGADPVELNLEGMLRAFRLGLKDLLPLWEQILTSDTLAEVLALEPSVDEPFRFPHDLWARVVYDFALAYHFRVVYRDHALRSLVPLYLARTAAFVRDTVRGTALDAERWIERSCRAFEQQKPYLIERWR